MSRSYNTLATINNGTLTTPQLITDDLEVQNLITDKIITSNISLNGNLNISGNINLLNSDNLYPDVNFNGIYRSIEGFFYVDIYESVNDSIVAPTILTYQIINNFVKITLEGVSFNLTNNAFLYVPKLQINQYLLTNNTISQPIIIYTNGPSVSTFGRVDLNSNIIPLNRYLYIFSGPSITDYFVAVNNNGFESFSLVYYL